MLFSCCIVSAFAAILIYIFVYRRALRTLAFDIA